MRKYVKSGDLIFVKEVVSEPLKEPSELEGM